MSFVLDGAMALAWRSQDQRTPATAPLNRVGETGSHRPLAVLNGLVTAERRGRLDPTRRRPLAGFLRDLPITLDSETTSQAWTAIQRLVFRPTIHDAVYLELAQRQHLPFASLDRDLRDTRLDLGVMLLGIVPA